MPIVSIYDTGIAAWVDFNKCQDSIRVYTTSYELPAWISGI